MLFTVNTFTGVAKAQDNVVNFFSVSVYFFIFAGHYFPFLGLPTFFQFQPETAIRLKKHLRNQKFKHCHHPPSFFGMFKSTVLYTLGLDHTYLYINLKALHPPSQGHFSSLDCQKLRASFLLA